MIARRRRSPREVTRSSVGSFRSYHLLASFALTVDQFSFLAAITLAYRALVMPAGPAWSVKSHRLSLHDVLQGLRRSPALLMSQPPNLLSAWVIAFAAMLQSAIDTTSVPINLFPEKLLLPGPNITVRMPLEHG